MLTEDGDGSLVVEGRNTNELVGVRAGGEGVDTPGEGDWDAAGEDGCAGQVPNVHGLRCCAFGGKDMHAVEEEEGSGSAIGRQDGSVGDRFEGGGVEHLEPVARVDSESVATRVVGDRGVAGSRRRTDRERLRSRIRARHVVRESVAGLAGRSGHDDPTVCPVEGDREGGADGGRFGEGAPGEGIGHHHVGSGGRRVTGRHLPPVRAHRDRRSPGGIAVRDRIRVPPTADVREDPDGTSGDSGTGCILRSDQCLSVRTYDDVGADGLLRPPGESTSEGRALGQERQTRVTPDGAVAEDDVKL